MLVIPEKRLLFKEKCLEEGSVAEEVHERVMSSLNDASVPSDPGDAGESLLCRKELSL